ASSSIPFAGASAVMIVVLELALPLRALDATWTRRDRVAPMAVATWNDAAWDGAPAAALVVLDHPSLMSRVVAARASGLARADLVFVPAFDLRGPDATRALVLEPKLAPFYRDVALGAQPEELGFAQLAAARPLVLAFDPRWDRALARHLVPLGLTTRFESEPRGASDRRQGLEAFAPARDRLVRDSVARAEPTLSAATIRMLRSRAIAMAACGERDVLAIALDDLRPFSPDDEVAAVLVRRTVLGRGPIDVRDLSADGVVSRR
ncbi:MAG: hypothetical protein KC657_22985, partial [Myxococcales bacterium]|nr:hypothetical protein [Myxococcales bacterium]